MLATIFSALSSRNLKSILHFGHRPVIYHGFLKAAAKDEVSSATACRPGLRRLSIRRVAVTCWHSGIAKLPFNLQELLCSRNSAREYSHHSLALHVQSFTVYLLWGSHARASSRLPGICSCNSWCHRRRGPQHACLRQCCYPG